MKSEQSDRSERLLALILIQDMKDLGTAEKAKKLNLAGFTNTEIADLLEVKPAIVSQRLYEKRRKKEINRKSQS